MITVWLHPEQCSPPHRVTHPEKVDALREQFMREGWAVGCPVLVGYLFERRIQLLSGSHRWAAAQRADIVIPVAVYSYEFVRSCVGNLELWDVLMRAPLSDGLMLQHLLQECSEFPV